ncbi:hypothetical protein GHT06_022665 [Daphnia sinensis]|uniref:Uncharacterized protein n=1 Tax=Daphnia sinensis TaxID=1820382 RepID=A0AAD5PLV1_9CRUS|nr:hypothetical protein GHT06_022665 [Daphnia sinensis]
MGYCGIMLLLAVVFLMSGLPRAPKYYTTTYAAPTYYSEAPKSYSASTYDTEVPVIYTTTYATPNYYTEAPTYYTTKAPEHYTTT